MNRCDRIMDAQRYFDGEMSPVQKKAFEEHLRGCAKCSGYLEEIGGVKNLLSMAERAEPPRGLSQRVLNAAEGRAAGRRANPFWAELGVASRRMVPMAAALSIILAVAATVSTYRMMNSSARTSTQASVSAVSNANTVSAASTTTTKAESSQAGYLCYKFSTLEDKILRHDPAKEDYYSVLATSSNGGTGYGKQ